MKYSNSLILIFLLVFLSFSATAVDSPSSEKLNFLNNETSGTTVFDYSGNNNDGTLNGDYVLGAEGAPNTTSNNKSIDFNNGSIQVSSSSELSGLSSITISYWVNFDETMEGGTVENFDHFRKVDEFSLGNSDCCGDGSSLAMGIYGDRLATSKNNWTAGNWNHVAFTLDTSSGDWKVYVNGELDNSKTTSETIASNSNDLFIANSASGGNLPFNGSLDEIKIFNKELSGSEVQNLSSCNSLSCSTSSNNDSTNTSNGNVWEDFETDLSKWRGDTNSFSLITNDAIRGSQSLKSNGSGVSMNASINSTAVQHDTVSFWVKFDDYDASTGLTSLMDEQGNRIIRVQADAGDAVGNVLRIRNTNVELVSSPTNGEWYGVQFENISYSNENFDFKVYNESLDQINTGSSGFSNAGSGNGIKYWRVADFMSSASIFLDNLDISGISLSSTFGLSNPVPSNNSVGVATDTDLEIKYEGSETANVSFYFKNGSLIQENTGVSPGVVTTTSNLNLTNGEEYSWYAVAETSSNTTTAGNYSFTTKTFVKDWFYNETAEVGTYGITTPNGKYVEEVNSTFVVIQGKDLDTYAFRYDHDIQEWSKGVEVGDNPLTADSHGVPSLTVDSDGYIHVFFGSHQTDVQYRRSSEPYNVSSWDTPASGFAPSHTYPQPIMVNNTIYHFYRNTDESGQRRYVYQTSSDGGDSWSSPNALVDYTDDSNYRIYASGPEREGNLLHFSWVKDQGGDNRTNLYYGYLNLSDNQIYGLDGTNYGSTITSSDSAKIYDSGTLQTNDPRVELDSEGDPHIGFLRELSNGSFMHSYIYHDGSSWSSIEGITATGGKYDGSNLYLENESNITAYLSVGSSGGQKAMEKHVFNGSSWSFDETIIDRGDFSYDNPTVVKNANSNLRVLFSERNLSTVYDNNDKHVFGYGESGFATNDLKNDATLGVDSPDDITPPTSSDNWTESGFVDKSEVTVRLNAIDNSGGSGVANISYRVNGGSYSTVSGNETDVNISTQGNNTLEYYATDNAGNQEAVNTEYVALDDTAFVGGNGSRQNPYEINSCEGLQDMEKDLGASYELISDVDCTNTSTWNNGKGFRPIGSVSNKFSGDLYGNSHVISNLSINRTSEEHVGLFGYTNRDDEIEVMDLGLENVEIRGNESVGGLGSIMEGLVANRVYVTGEVYSNNLAAGFVLSDGIDGVINNSYSNVDVFGTSDPDTFISSAGFSSITEEIIKNSYSVGSVEEGGNVAGFTSSLTGVISNSYWDTQSSGLDTGIATNNGDSADLTGLTTNEMTYPNEINNINFDFGRNWIRDSDLSNNGYPELCWEDPQSPNLDNTTYKLNQSNNLEQVKIDIWSCENNINGSTGIGNLNLLSNSSMAYDVSLPVNGVYSVEDANGLSSNRTVILSKNDTGVVEDKSFNHNLSVQKELQNITVNNEGGEKVFYEVSNNLGNTFTGSISASNSVVLNDSVEFDYLNESQGDFSPSSNSLTLDLNYTGIRSLTVENNASTNFSDVSTLGGLTSPNRCYQVNNTKINVLAESTFNDDVLFDCSPGTAGSPGLTKTTNVGNDNHTEYYYNTTDMEIYSNETRQSNIVWKIDRDNLNDFANRSSPPTGYLDGNSSGIDVDIGSSFVYVNFTIDCCTSSPSEGVYSASLNYEVEEEDTTIVQPNGGGGGSTQPTTDEQTIYFGQDQTQDGLETFNVPFNETSVRNLTITNPSQEGLIAELIIGSEAICQYVSVRPALNTDSWSGSGTYDVPAASPNQLGTIQDATVDTQVRFELPARSELESQGISKFSCEFQTGSSYGVAEPLVAEVKAPLSLEGILDSLGLGQELCIPVPSAEITENSEIKDTSGEVCQPLAIWLSLLALILILGYVTVMFATGKI